MLSSNQHNQHNYQERLKETIILLEENKHNVQLFNSVHKNLADDLNSLFASTPDSTFVEWIQTQTTDNKNSFAQYTLGVMFYYGCGVSKNVNETRRLLALSDQQGNILASVGQASDFVEQGIMPSDEGKKVCRVFADQGYNFAQNRLGRLYFKSQNFTEAFYWFQRSADQGNRHGIYNLAKCYEAGTGCERDLEKAKQLFASSSSKGFKGAMEGLERILRMSHVDTFAIDELCNKYVENAKLKDQIDAQREELDDLRKLMSECSCQEITVVI